MQSRPTIIIGCTLFLIIQTSLLFADNPAESAREENKPLKAVSTTKEAAVDVNNTLLIDILKKMDTTYQALSSFQADFEQESETMVMQKRKKSSGDFYFQKPNKMRWLYRQPENRDIYLVAEKILIYLPSRQQVLKQALDKTLPGMAPARLFMGTKELIESFTISLVPGATTEDDTVYCLLLLPKEKGKMSVEKIFLSIRKNDFLPTKTETFDILGNRTTLIFRNGKVNIDLKDELFNFKIPADVEIIENPY